MKTILLIIPLVGVTLLTTAGETAKPEDANTTKVSAPSDTKPAPGGMESATTIKLGERLARSGIMTAKPDCSLTKGFLQSLNPFAPVKPTPTTPWLSRASWSTAATSGVASSTPIEMRHEAQSGVIVSRQ